jgi:N-acetylmuramoyl-L-alanine amidase
MQIGVISVDGRPIGTVTMKIGTPDAVVPRDDRMASLGESPDFSPSAIPGGTTPSHHGFEGHHPHGSPDGGKASGGAPVPYAAAPVGGDRVHGRLAEARDRARDELKAKPWLNEKAMHIIAGENDDPNAATAVWEETINCAAVRGTSIEKELGRTNEGGYYEGWRSNVSPETRKVLEAAPYSNVSNYATDNASGDRARHDRETGHFTERKVLNGEHFFGPDNRIPKHVNKWNELVHESETMRAAGASAPAADSSGQPGRVPGIEPQAFIMHHTGGGNSVRDIKDTLSQRHLGVEYIMDRNGNITMSGGPGSSHMLPGWGAGEGLNNRNTVGMEVIAKDDKDVTPAQVAAARAFISKNYPNTPVMGHGLVNPGHKEADEGKTITDAINADRARGAAQANSKPVFDPETMAP